MIQLYPIRLFIIAFAALLSFMEVYKAELASVLRIKRMLERNLKVKRAVFISVLLLSFMTLLFPLYPGPAILGDLLPAIALFFAAFAIKGKKGGDEVEAIFSGDLLSNSNFRKGMAFSIAFALDLIFPGFIIL